MTKVKEFRNFSDDELIEKCDSLERELFDLKTQSKTGRVEKPGRFKEIRRDIARILTVLKEKK